MTGGYLGTSAAQLAPEGVAIRPEVEAQSAPEDVEQSDIVRRDLIDRGMIRWTTRATVCLPGLTTRSKI